ncbi:MAG: ribosomal protein S18-alanine N-acetyltransferase [Nitrosomonas sp.]|nr:MAG: ribosomal protein S18-alanine N-acetyltransferase [Nitrosomonas sp.]
MNAALGSAVTIRAMMLPDIDRIILIEREIFLFPWSPGNFADSIKSGYYCRVLVQEKVLAGYGIMMLSPEEAHVLTLGVASDRQGRGLGKCMLQHLIDYARTQGAKSVFLDVRDSNHGAAQLYQRMGFQQIAIRKDYYPAMCGRENARVMQLPL